MERTITSRVALTGHQFDKLVYDKTGHFLSTIDKDYILRTCLNRIAQGGVFIVKYRDLLGFDVEKKYINLK